MPKNETTVRIEVPISAFNRQQIADAVGKDFDVQLVYTTETSDLEQHLDAATATAIAGLMLGIIQIGLTIWDLKKKKEWNLDSLTDRVRQRAAEFTGLDEITDVKYAGLADFLEKKQDFCTVTADIHDELYTFVVLREGSVIVIKQESD